MLQRGASVAGRYVVEGCLGGGGMGAVYVARDQKLDREVAVKVLHASVEPDEEARERLLREARAAARITHPGIVEIYDVDETADGEAFVVMERVRGRSLRSLLVDGALPRDEALRIIAELADALATAHAEGLVHRDVKPDNAMLRDDGRVVLLDFGLVKRIEEPLTRDDPADTPTLKKLTQSGAIVGTPAYLAPEQCRGVVSPAVDQWALAVTAFELLSGELPWDPRDAAYLLAQILTDEAPALSSSADATPPEADAAIARALAKDPDARFKGVRAFAEALLGAFGRAMPERRSGPISAEAVAATARTRPARWHLALPVIALLVGLSVWFLGGGDSEPESSAAAPTLAGPLADDAVIACPLFETEGVTEPAGWLGAGAADLTCRRLDAYLGARGQRVRVPARLLGFPAVPGDDFPEDPYVEPDARTRSLEAARTDTDAWIEGRVARAEDGAYRVALSLRGVAGAFGESSGEAPNLFRAVGDAVAALVESGAVRPTAPDPLVARWFGVETVEQAVAWRDRRRFVFEPARTEELCQATYAPESSAPVVLRAEMAPACALFEPDTRLPPPRDARTTDEAVTEAWLAHVREPDADAAALADRISAARETLDGPWERAIAGSREAWLRAAAGDEPRASALLRVALEAIPGDASAYELLWRSTWGTPAIVPLAWGAVAWRPGDPETYRIFSVTPGFDRSFERRAYELSSAPPYGVFYGRMELREGRFEEARAIAARYLAGPPEHHVAGAALQAAVDAYSGRLARAYEQLLARVLDARWLAQASDYSHYAMQELLFYAGLLGRREEAADAMSRRFVLSEPHRLTTTDPGYQLIAVPICSFASEAVRRPCIDRLVELDAAHPVGRGGYDLNEPLLRGARCHAEGDLVCAATHWRQISVAYPYMPLDVFERAGLLEVARRVDQRLLARYGAGRLASLAHAREARRLAAEGEMDRARALARRFVESWGDADAEVVELAAMRALLTDSATR